MTLRLPTVALMLLTTLSLSAQVDCLPTAYRAINANQVKAYVSNGGDFFNDSGDDPGFSVPYVAGAPERYTLFTAGLMIAGLTPAGNLRSAFSRYRGTPDQTDFRPGPLADLTGEVIPGACQDFDRIWATNRFEVQLLRADFADNGIIDDPIPVSLRQWPAQGNPYFQEYFGFELPFQALAPFHDENGDGSYDPADGDYPVLDPTTPEVIPDELLWTVFNDATTQHFFQGEPLRVEVQLLVFAFNCGDDELLNATVFTRHRIINRSGVNLSDFRLGLFIDPDVGCFDDDYLGVDSTLSTAYFYNSDLVDGSNDCVCSFPVNSYCQAPPAHTVTFLSHPMSSFLFQGNPSVTPGLPPVFSSPNTPAETFNVLSGRWITGEPVTRGGTGYNPGSTDTTLFAFSGPADEEGWTMLNQDIPEGDYRAIPAAHLTEFIAGQILTFDMAHAFHQDPETDFYGQINSALERIPDLQSLHDNGYATPCQQSALCTEDCVWPGDANNSGIVEPFDGLSIGLAAGQVATGPERPLANNQWRAQDAEAWAGTGSGGVNFKHADANGDGIVDRLDGAVFDLNYAKQRPGATPPPDVPATDDEFGLRLTHSRELLDADAPVVFQRLTRTTVALGSEENPVEAVYGIAFTVLYDTDLMEYSNNLPFPLVELPGATPFGNSEGIVAYAYGDPASGRVEVVICRTDGQNISGTGDLARITLVLRADALTGNSDGTADIIYQVVNVRAVNAAGEALQLGARVDTIQAVNLTYDPTLSTDRPRPSVLRLFPNPTRGELNVELPSGWRGALQLEVFDATGRQVLSRRESAHGPVLTTQLPKNLPRGLYWVRLRNEEGALATGKTLYHE